MEAANETLIAENVDSAIVDEKSAGNILLVIFKLGKEEYALPIDQIKEVVLTPKVSRIPQTPPYIKGVANIRGTVISIVDLEERFGLIGDESTSKVKTLETENESDEDDSNYTLVIESEDYKIGVLVKDVPNTLSVKISDIDSTSGLLKHSSLDENAINGIVKIDDRMIIMIDILAMMESGEIKITN